jgi:hypothetical protein
MQAHVHDAIESVEFTKRALDDDRPASVWFFFGDVVAQRPGDRPAVVFWIRNEQQREALRLALRQALEALESWNEGE